MTEVFAALDREWEAVRRDTAAGVDVADVLAAAGVATLGGLERWIRSAPPATADRVLFALVVDAVGGSATAARVALQLLQPGVRRMVGAGVGRDNDQYDRDERAAAVLAAVYARIVTYPVT